MTQLQAAVGLRGYNRKSDVATVQAALAHSGVLPGPIDGICGIKTLKAIEAFQRPFLDHVDGRVDVDGPTWRRLEHVRHTSEHPEAHAHATGPNFPHATTAAAAAQGVSHSTRPVAAIALPPHPAAGPPLAQPKGPIAASPIDAAHYWHTRTDLPKPSEVNEGLTCPSAAQMTALLGDPHSENVQSHLKTTYVGKLHVTGRDTAIASLQRIFADVQREQPGLYAVIGTAGVYNLRNIGGSHCYSNHSWGTAIDITVESDLIQRGDPHSFKGYDAIYPYFHREGWFWGGGYWHGKKDSMHFEMSVQKVNGG